MQNLKYLNSWTISLIVHFFFARSEYAVVCTMKPFIFFFSFYHLMFSLALSSCNKLIVKLFFQETFLLWTFSLPLERIISRQKEFKENFNNKFCTVVSEVSSFVGNPVLHVFKVETIFIMIFAEFVYLHSHFWRYPDFVPIIFMIDENV